MDADQGQRWGKDSRLLIYTGEFKNLCKNFSLAQLLLRNAIAPVLLAIPKWLKTVRIFGRRGNPCGYPTIEFLVVALV